jgi:hypothetical protein
VPSPLAFHDTASLLPISKTQIRSEPLAADPAGSLFVFTLFFHRFLRRMTLRKQWSISFRLGIKVDGSPKPVGKKIK